MGEVGAYQDCFRCGQRIEKKTDHRSYTTCRGDCMHCGDQSHDGLMCPRYYCTRAFWNDRVGLVPQGIRFRPTEEQRKVLAGQDSFFEQFHLPIGLKRRAEETVDFRDLGPVQRKKILLMKKSARDAEDAAREAERKKREAQEELEKLKAEIEESRRRMRPTSQADSPPRIKKEEED